MINVSRTQTEEDLQKVFGIRRKVFVEEQQVDEAEEYEFEDESVHFLALADGIPAGAARWRRTDKGIKLERFAVLPEYRGAGVGSALVSAVLDDIPQDAEFVYLHAQLTAVGLYKKFGFREEGDMFEEANIKHYKMVWEK